MNAAELAGRLGAKRSSRSFRCNCPACGYHGAFSIRSGRNGNALVWCANSCTRDSLDTALRHIAGDEWKPPAPVGAAEDETQRQRRRDAALRLWNGTTVLAGTLGEAYLQARALPSLVVSPALRFRADAPHPEHPRLPAMVALIQDAAGAPIAVHRTFLAADGSGKASVTPAKASLGPLWGGAIRLQPHDPALPLVVGEGIETAASAGVLTGHPAWAAISAGNMAKGLQLPPEVRHVVIAVDPDVPGERAAQEAASRWQREGRRVQLARPHGNGDFNDLLLAGGHHA